jgi:hypothetical protein
MIRDPERRGREIARLWSELAPELLIDLEASGLIGPADRPRLRREWETFALYACVRGLVAGGGFNRETAAAIDALHDAALDGWRASDHDGEPVEARRALISARYEEYGGIGQAGGKSGAATVPRRLGEAAARHMLGTEAPPPGLAELAGHLHESLAEGAAEMVRREEER